MGVDVVTERRDNHPILAPFVRADQSQQFAECNQCGLFIGAIRFRAGESKIGGAAETNVVVVFKGHEKHAEDTRPAGLSLSMKMEGLRRRGAGLGGMAVGTPGHGVE